MTIKAGPCGGDGGTAFSMDNTDNITRIVNIGVAFSANRIEAITIKYFVEGDNNEKSVTWGTGGNWQYFPVKTGEYITSIKGYYGNPSVDGWFGLRALTFWTFRPKTGEYTPHGPYGSEVGTEFQLPGINGKIIGFHGRSGTIGLDALGVYVKVDDTSVSTGTGNN